MMSSDAVMKNCDAQSCSDGALMCYDVVLMHSDAAVEHSDAVLVHSDVVLMWPDALMSFDVDVLQERVEAESDGWSCCQFLLHHFLLKKLQFIFRKKNIQSKKLSISLKLFITYSNNFLI